MMINQTPIGDEELDMIKTALRSHYENLLDDQHEGADHGDEIDLLEGLNYKLNFIDWEGY